MSHGYDSWKCRDEAGEYVLMQSGGLTKREYFAATLPMDADEVKFNEKEALEQFIGRAFDENDTLDMARAACELEAKFRVMKADALLAELERTK